MYNNNCTVYKIIQLSLLVKTRLAFRSRMNIYT